MPTFRTADHPAGAAIVAVLDHTELASVQSGTQAFGLMVRRAHDELVKKTADALWANHGADLMRALDLNAVTVDAAKLFAARLEATISEQVVQAFQQAQKTAPPGESV